MHRRRQSFARETLDHKGNALTATRVERRPPPWRELFPRREEYRCRIVARYSRSANKSLRPLRPLPPDKARKTTRTGGNRTDTAKKRGDRRYQVITNSPAWTTSRSRPTGRGRRFCKESRPQLFLVSRRKRGCISTVTTQRAETDHPQAVKRCGSHLLAIIGSGSVLAGTFRT